MARKKIIPKRIGTLKIPKSVRRFGDRVLSDPRSRELAAGALMALGSALASRKAPKGSFFRDIFDHPARAARTAETAGAEAAAKAEEAGSGIAGAASQLAGEIVDALRRELGKKRAASGEEDDRLH